MLLSAAARSYCGHGIIFHIAPVMSVGEQQGKIVKIDRP